MPAPEKKVKKSKKADLKQVESVEVKPAKKDKKALKAQKKAEAEAAAKKAAEAAKKAAEEAERLAKEQEDSSSSDSSSSDSSSEDEKPAAKTEKKAEVAKKEESSDSSSDSSSEDEKPVAKKEESSDSSSDSSSDEEETAVAAKKEDKMDESSDDSSSSDSEDEKEDKKAVAKKDADGEADTSSSDSSSDSSDSSDDEEKTEKVTVGEKRKTSEDAAPAKKMKTETGSAPAPGAQEITTCFVGNLSFDLDEDTVWSTFDEWVGAGSVKEVRLITDRNTGRAKGYGYVEFNTSEQANKALEYNDTDVSGRNVRIELSTPRPEKTQSRGTGHVGQRNPPADTLFIGNLSFDTWEDGVRELFSAHGKVVSVRLPTDKESGDPKGFGYVQFSEISEAQSAIEALNGADLDGRNIRIDFAAPRKEQGGNASQLAGDWYCPDAACGNNNFARRSTCFKCQAPRPGGAGAAGGAPRGRGGARGGARGGRGGARGGFNKKPSFQGTKITFD